MIREIVALAAIAASGAGCKVRRGETVEAAISKMSEFADKMCACNGGDKACADKVQEEMNRWGSEQARNAGSVPVSEAQTKQMTDVTTRYGKCMMTAMGETGLATPDPEPGSAAAPKLPRDISAMLKQIRNTVARMPRKLVLSRLELYYARYDDTLDPEYGGLAVGYRIAPASPADDPKRPIGAPLPQPSREETAGDCPSWQLVEGTLRDYVKACNEGQLLAAPHCTTAQVWARALADQAPQAALATLELKEASGADPQRWDFAISDPPRHIDFRKLYRDDCEPIVEQPPK